MFIRRKRRKKIYTYKRVPFRMQKLHGMVSQVID